MNNGEHYFFLIPFWIIILVFFYREFKIGKERLTSSDLKYEIATLFILGIGVLVRTIYLQYPYLFYGDESNAGYDAWCLVNYGVDQHTNAFPVYLKSWGSGQSALYAYLSIPFIKILGLNFPVLRLTMAFWSCFSILLFYYTLRKTQDNSKLVFSIIFMIAICPWHIAKSRWALDCNLASEFILIGTSLFILAYYTAKQNYRLCYYVLGALALALSAYAYGVSWFMLPIYVILLYAFLLKRKKISILQLALSLGLIVIVVSPLILFAYNISLGNNEIIKLGSITIPSLNGGRQASTTVFGSYDPWRFFKAYLYTSARIFLYGFDNMKLSSLPFFGQYYNVFSNIFIIYAIVKLIKKQNRIVLDYIMFIWFVSNIFIILVVEPSGNHWNTLWFSIIYFIGRGIYFCIIRFRSAGKIIFPFYIILFIAFLWNYSNTFSSSKEYYYEIQSFLKFSNSKKFDHIYIDKTVQHPQTLFMNPISPYLYHVTKVPDIPGFPMEFMDKYSNINLSFYDEIEIKDNSVYILLTDKLAMYNIDYNKVHCEKGVKYSLIWTD